MDLLHASFVINLNTLREEKKIWLCLAFVSGERLLRAAEKEIVGPNSKRFRGAFHYIRASKSRVHQGKGCGTAGRNMWIPGYLYRPRLIYEFRLTFRNRRAEFLESVSTLSIIFAAPTNFLFDTLRSKLVPIRTILLRVLCFFFFLSFVL